MSSEFKGTVYLIGAGPGDPGLITERGRQLLERCDTVVYDNLVPAELIIKLRQDVDKIYVGKKAADHALPQGEINTLLVELANAGREVVRLKGADPLIFGRGGEEARYLKKHDVPFEIVPGVTAAIGAAAYSGIPCTDRNLASHVTFATGHKSKDKKVSSVPWDHLAKSTNGTLVIYMGVGEVAQIVSRLINGGMDGSTPAAIVERGTTSTQRRIISTLAELPDTVNEKNVKPPALFIIGKVVTLHKDIEWLSNKPLFGKRVMVLRPVDQAGAMYQRLRDLGAEVLPYPTIATEEHVDDDAWLKVQLFDADHRWLIFTSENGVRYFMEQFATNIGDVRQLAPYRIAAVGFGTARALHEAGLQADFMPGQATVATMATQFCDGRDLTNAEVVRVQGNLSDNTVYDTLTTAGATVVPLTVYETVHPEWPEGFKEQLLDNPPDTIIFTSGSSAQGLTKMLSEDERNSIVARANLISIGPSTTKIIESLGMKVNIEADVHSVDGIIDRYLDSVSEQAKKETP